MKKKLVLVILLLTVVKTTLASITFFNNSEQGTLVVYYSIASFNPFTMSPIYYTKPIPPKSFYIDNDIIMIPTQRLDVQQVTATLPNQSPFTTRFVAKAPALSSCNASSTSAGAYGNGGVLLYTFDNQRAVTCTASTGIN